MEFFLTLVGFVLIVEGAGYALFPSGMKKMMIQILSMKDSSLQNIGMTMMLTGAVIAWLVNKVT